MSAHYDTTTYVKCNVTSAIDMATELMLTITRNVIQYSCTEVFQCDSDRIR